MTCVTDSDFKAIAESGISQFNKAVERIPFDSCALFRDEASRLEAGLLGVYRVVVSMVRREEDIEKVSECWGSMVAICDKYAERLGVFQKQHPACGAELFYDRILDLRNKCRRMHALHA
jgi:hypothetical protein